MLKERRSKIIAAVNESGVMTFAALSRMFPDISEMTLRKDLKSLDEQGQLVRIHGGARALNTVGAGDTPLKQRLTQNIEKKRQIAHKARALLRPHINIFMDSGSTLTELAKAFVDQPCTVFTCGLSCINELSRLKEVDVFILGGLLNRDSLSVHDYPLVLRQIDQINFDLCFIASGGFTRESGFCCKTSGRWEMEKTVLRRTKKKVILMDSTKDGVSSGFTICTPEDIDVLVSDDELSEATRQYLERAGMEVL